MRSRGVGRWGRRGRWAVSLLLAVVFALPGCGGPKNFLNDNDTLRRENLALQREVEKLNEQLRLRIAEVTALRDEARRVNGTNAQPGADGAASPEGSDPPVLAGVQIDRYSGPVDTDGDGIDDVVRIYVYPVDQKGRMLPVAGTLTVRLVSIPAEGAPAVIAETTLPPDAFDAAYRTGFTGPFYRTELVLPDDCPDTLAARVVLRQVGTSVAVSSQAGYRVQRPQ